ncbi:MAG: tetratricopeptide repeat protein [Anaerolineae bacterium]|nr:tetratricopeptide repeat protein [Phycisphaerae bacterium]
MKLQTQDMDIRPAASGYSIDELAEIVGVPLADVSKWVSRGLLVPSADHERFHFQQLSRAQTLRDLVASGASLKKLRDAMSRFSASLTTSPSTVVCNDGQVFARLQNGELMSPVGQLQMDFAPDVEPLPLSSRQPQSAAQWYECGIAHEIDGRLALSIDCYREALLAGGPDTEICFALAHALAETGAMAQAAERYGQVVEMDPKQADAWNNLGVALCELKRHDEACRAFRHALELKPDDAGARFNLADALDETGNASAAQPHWQAYLRHDRSSERAAYARRRLSAS